MEATLERDGRLTIPQEVRRAAKPDEGDIVEFEVVADGLLLRRREEDDDLPHLPDPPYYGTPEWDAGFEEALANVAAGNVIHFGSGEEFLTELRRRSKNANLQS